MGAKRVYARKGGRKLWTPKRIFKDLVLWLDASDLATVTQSAGLLSQLMDKSPNGYHAVQAGADALKPGWALDSTYNNRGVLSFTGANYLTGALVAAGSDLTLCVIGQFGSGSGSGARMFCMSSTAVDTSVDGFCAARATTAAQFRFIYNGVNGSQKGVTYDTPFVSTLVKDSGNAGAGCGVNGNTVGTLDAVTGSYNSTRYALGVSLNAANAIGTIFMVGKVAEVILVKSVLDAYTQRKVEGYFSHKYGQRLNLLSQHQYRPAPPTY